MIGVDISDDAIKSAIENTKLNKINNVSFYRGDVFEVIRNINEKPDVIVLDPPRAGVNAKALEKIVEFSPRENLESYFSSKAFNNFLAVVSSS